MPFGNIRGTLNQIVEKGPKMNIKRVVCSTCRYIRQFINPSW